MPCCSRTGARTVITPPASADRSVPSLPGPPVASPQPGQPPVLWVAGTLTAVSPERLELQEPSGATITLQRLGEGATAFFRISGGEWRRVAAVAGAGAEGLSCVETVMAGSNLVALRVFLGAGCGPA